MAPNQGACWSTIALCGKMRLDGLSAAQNYAERQIVTWQLLGVAQVVASGIYNPAPKMPRTNASLWHGWLVP